MKWTGLVAMLFVPFSAWAQWNVPVPLVLDGASTDDRQVKDLSLPTEVDHGANAASVRERSTTYAVAQGVDDLTVALVPTATAYTAGMLVSISPVSTNTGGSTLNIDGLGTMPIMKFTNLPLDSADLRAGVPALMVFDGAAFQLISQTGIACPPGFLDVSRDVCVEAVPYGPANWYTAVSQCSARGLRLCGWADWFRGCSMPGGFVNTIVEYEWVDSAANDNNHGKRVGLETGTTNPDCYAGGTQIPLGMNNFRCCYNK
ncbi:MAG: hypothetical protein KA230_06425 [Flavobacteriales bacterium]|nr:hypothetical protein [Flavobacteriales bacterium]